MINISHTMPPPPPQQQQQQQQHLLRLHRHAPLLSVFPFCHLLLLLLLLLFFFSLANTIAPVDAVSIPSSSSSSSLSFTAAAVKLQQRPGHGAPPPLPPLSSTSLSTIHAQYRRPFHFPPSPAKLCKQCYSTADQVRACLDDTTTTKPKHDDSHCDHALTKDEVMQLCALSRQRWTPDTVYCDGLNALRKRRHAAAAQQWNNNKHQKAYKSSSSSSSSSSSCATGMKTKDMPDYVMLNGIEVLFIRQLYAAGVDVASRLIEVLEFPPWYMSILSSSSSSSSSSTTTRTAVREEGRRRTELGEDNVSVRSNTDNIRPIVAQFKIESEGEKFQDTVKRAFQRMRKKKGFEDIRGEIRREGDNVFIVFYFESEHLNEY